MSSMGGEKHEEDEGIGKRRGTKKRKRTFHIS
jgi:hypothetical protein